MVEEQIEARGVADDRVLTAMRTVPRECFVPEGMVAYAYEDTPLPIEEGQTISQPLIVAIMIEALGLGPDARVLEIGAGSGYAAAVLGRIARRVYAVERFDSLASQAGRRLARLGYDNVTVVCGDGTLGWPEHGPYDAILVSAGGPEVPEPLLEQLAIGGCLVIPVGTEPRSQVLFRVRRTAEDAFVKESLGRVHFVPLIGTEGWTTDGRPVARHRARRRLRVDTQTPFSPS